MGTETSKVYSASGLSTGVAVLESPEPPNIVMEIYFEGGKLFFPGALLPSAKLLVGIWLSSCCFVLFRLSRSLRIAGLVGIKCRFFVGIM